MFGDLRKEIDAAYTGNYEPRGDIKNAKIIVGQAFGRRTEDGAENGRIIRDPINDQLAEYISDQELDEALKFLQLEISLGYTALTGIDPDRTIERVMFKRFGLYLDCFEVGFQGLLGALRSGRELKGVMALSHGRQVMRFARQLEYFGVDQNEIIIPEGLTVEHDPESVQPWTRSPEEWIKREKNGLYVLHGIGRLYTKVYYPNLHNPKLLKSKH